MSSNNELVYFPLHQTPGIIVDKGVEYDACIQRQVIVGVNEKGIDKLSLMIRRIEPNSVRMPPSHCSIWSRFSACLRPLAKSHFISNFIPCHVRFSPSNMARIGRFFEPPKHRRRGHLVHKHPRENILCWLTSVRFFRINDFHKPDVMFSAAKGLACMVENY